MTSRSAYIESAHFTQEPVSYSYDWYTNQFADYLKVRFPAVSYELQEAHIGKIPLNSHTFSRLVSPHVVRIGAAAGLVKSGTGYGFTRIVEDTLQLVNSLCIYNNPLHTGHPSRMYHLLDECLLHSMTDKPYKVKRLFSDLFTHSIDGDILLDFLNEKLGFKDAYSLLTQLDPRPIIPSVVPTVFKIY